MKIKPCPFCAREVEVVKFHVTCYCVACKCGAEAPGNSVSENGAIRIWNRRRMNSILLAKWQKRWSDMLASAEEGFYEKGNHHYNVKEHHFNVAARQWSTAIEELEKT